MSEHGMGAGGQRLVALDLEGVLAPEIWQAVAAATGVETLTLTTREIADYEELMQIRIRALAANGIRFSELLTIVDRLEPLPGAVDFLDKLRAECPVVILSDTFEQLADAMLAKLGRPFTMCHRLELDGEQVVGFRLRDIESKQQAVRSFRGLGYRVTAAGDSHNDVTMLEAADRGCLIRPPDAVRQRCPQFVAVDDLDSLADWILAEG